ncbi:MAG: bifunctional 5,10-methylene-tetrahydrofolate dehydrogenase/5,10-methylene-tetrahydrofolate cyclohydrolase [Clostridiales bacterium GWF2_36_10]|nr:MAG: bifunctional 5,10-methylene-tetrahydrofolate dehydrogenase/5,10-methylene-tetrahydrofolate cyclohydrolase [Clostridiales bacterium GWF2_36_10]HAN20204.1 bifunctional methylenetetrahydrofolate dehydrogenase/methenyltetrahydrofolate cyclohydrolase FolD [Clostridiales bacterium]
MAIILDGKIISQKVKDEIAVEVNQLVSDGNRPPCLAVVLVGDDEGSKVYVRNKKRACEAIGFTSLEFILPTETLQDELDKLIDFLNDDDNVDGILVQLPLPKHLNEMSIINRISTKKDVDAFHPENVGRIMLGNPLFLPCTPAGVMRMLKDYNISVSGKECVVVGRSNIVGKPMSLLLLAANGTVTTCHSRTLDLAEVTRRADILVVAIGIPRKITGDMIKEGAVVIDVGMNRSDGVLCGDVDFTDCLSKASYITPVPGGVGLMTIAMLMQNTLTAYKLHMGIK